MTGTRYFNGGRDGGKRSIASEMMRIEIQKKGKLPAADRYRLMLKKRLAESKQQALGSKVKTFSLPGSIKEVRQISARAERALKEIAMKKAAKDAKALRQMVIVTPRTYPMGNITQKGKIYDVAGNLVAEVNTKNGKMSTMNGWSIGRYKPKSYFTDMNIQEAITKYSPFLINQRKMQAMAPGQNFGVFGPGFGTQEVINVYAPETAAPTNYYGSDVGGPRQNIGMTSWGARSDNVWGTYTDNVWGGSLDNVWGSNSTDVWGGIGVGGLWGGKGPNVWGTGNGKNYLQKVTGSIMALFGMSTKGNRQKLKALNAGVRSGSGSSGGNSTRTAARTSR